MKFILHCEIEFIGVYVGKELDLAWNDQVIEVLTPDGRSVSLRPQFHGESTKEIQDINSYRDGMSFY